MTLPLPKSSPKKQKTKQKPTVALVIDPGTWAFAYIAKQIKQMLSSHYRFNIIPLSEDRNLNKVLAATRNHDLTHLLWHSVTTQSAATLAERNFSRRITASIYSGPAEPTDTGNALLFNRLLNAYTVSSGKLMNLHRQIDGLQAPSQLTENGVSLDIFQPLNLKRLEYRGWRPMVIGWAGDSTPPNTLDPEQDPCGLHTLLKPAIDQLRASGLDIRLKVFDRQQQPMAERHMIHYYANIDLFVCTSKSAGASIPALEATACGVPVISTRIGALPKLLGDTPFKSQATKRNLASLKKAIHQHYLAGGDHATAISQYGLKHIRAWDWSKKIKNFHMFFNTMLLPNN